MENSSDNTLKLTCLHERHVRLGAKMSPFAGFDMPIQYSSIVEEHNAVRNAAGLFDVSHMGEITVSGPDARKFVNHVFTNDVSSLESGKIIYGMMLHSNGGTVDDLIVYKGPGEEDWLLVVNAANIAKDYAHLQSCTEGFDVKVTDRSDKWGQIALQGPDSERLLLTLPGMEDCPALGFYEFRTVTAEGSPVIVSRSGYTGEDGFEIYAAPALICEFWDKLLAAGALPCGLGCRDTLRFEAGLPLYGHELADDISPIEAGLGMFCKLDKADGFIGCDALRSQKENGVSRKLVGIEVHDRAIPRAGYAVELEDETQIGTVTTGYRSISLDRSLCFALVDARYAALGTALKVRIHRHVFPAEVVRKRFYQTNYKK